jgi:RimJ/RimL family protein N-acetyltransferase
MDQHFTLTSPELNAIMLRTIAEPDGEHLRQWKNANRFSFFFQEIITPEGQVQWFRNYLQRPDDYMFVVLHADQPIGCMGFRFVAGVVDIYNVIRGISEIGERGTMSQALRLMCSYIIGESKADIVAQVLLSNPAIAWYQKNGFEPGTEHPNYIEMKLNRSRFHPCAVVRWDVAISI